MLQCGVILLKILKSAILTKLLITQPFISDWQMSQLGSDVFLQPIQLQRRRQNGRNHCHTQDAKDHFGFMHAQRFQMCLRRQLWLGSQMLQGQVSIPRPMSFMHFRLKNQFSSFLIVSLYLVWNTIWFLHDQYQWELETLTSPELR